MKLLYYLIMITIPTFMHANMLELGFMLAAQMGGQIANQALNQTFQGMIQQISTEDTNLATTSSTFQNQINTTQQHAITTMIQAFKNGQTKIDQLTNAQATEVEQIEQYLTKMISLQVPTQEYLTTPINYDELFVQGTMYTPTGPAWKNTFQIGNWEYDHASNSFWQMCNIPMLSQTITPASIDAAYQNSIFTEWITRTSYEIFCEITLYQLSYPFCVGIIFNKARWISGDTYGIQKYRLLALYGANSNKISLCYAEQLTPPDQSTAPQYPLEQIYNETGIQSAVPIDQKIFTTLTLQPITIYVKIKPDVAQISYKVWFKNNIEPKKYTVIKTKNIQPTTKVSTVQITTQSGVSTTIAAANFNDMYLYHGIGFIAPGAIAQFKLLQPQELMFSKQAIQQYATELQSYITQQQQQTTTTTIDSTMLAKG